VWLTKRVFGLEITFISILTILRYNSSPWPYGHTPRFTTALIRPLELLSGPTRTGQTLLVVEFLPGRLDRKESIDRHPLKCDLLSRYRGNASMQPTSYPLLQGAVTAVKPLCNQLRIRYCREPLPQKRVFPVSLGAAVTSFRYSVKHVTNTNRKYQEHVT
jgi:hypothetical protein